MSKQCEKVSSIRMIPYNHKLAPLHIRNNLYSLIPDGTEQIYVVGIGSNLISGDSLGPFVGTFLRDLFPNHLTVVGNLEHPLDATTLVPTFSQIKLPTNSFVVAIDSVISTEGFVNSIVIRDGSLLPGEGLGQKLPPIGDCSVMGVMLREEPMNISSLLYTNLHFIYTMAMNIARGIALLVRQYFRYPSDHPILRSN
ncbi:spore protease YyaC [Halalkalibacter kiskunsagensis]|uniref:Spore protease YyaC n=1 Tax=Halalkalibacter kiskunsagensis TaxID=1548599 RepID=A0ABV6KAT5_9BACI